MDPYYFGDPGNPLFGILAAPDTSALRNTGVLFCHPMGQEYMRAYWAIRQLAEMLARAGFPALRFDYYGTGDSAGNSKDISVERWQADIHAAIDELKRRTGTAHVSLVGLRFGATLAAMTTAQRDDIRNLVLWDPVVVGRDFLSTLDGMHRQRLIDTLRAPIHVDWTRTMLGEQLGYPLPAPMRATIERLDLTTVAPGKAGKTWLVVTEDRPACQALRTSLAASGVTFDYQAVTDACEWDSPDKVEKALLPSRVMQTIASVLKQDGA